MRIENAKELLPSFKFMEGMYSEIYQKNIRDVFIGYNDPTLTKELYRNFRQGTGFPSLPTDFGNYTICAAFEDYTIQEVKAIVELDKEIQLNFKFDFLELLNL